MQTVRILGQTVAMGLIAFSLVACNDENIQTANISATPPDSNNTMLLTAPAGHPANVRHILFAHGYKDDKLVWNTYAHYINNSDTYSQRWTVHRFSVPKTGSIEERATQLAGHINDLNLDDDSMIAVGHSMGGLDLRYIIAMGHDYERSKDENLYQFYTAAKKIHKVYTLASPHRGNMFAGNPSDDGAKDLGIDNMRLFNEKHPITTFSIDGRKIQFLAMRFKCSDADLSDGSGSRRACTKTDGTVAVERQILFGAPHTQSILRGKHTDSYTNLCDGDNPLETENIDKVLKAILDNKQFYTDRFDIVFYEETKCEGDENGFYSSTYKRGTIKCGDSKPCKNDRTSSVKIYPGVHKHLTIRLFDNPDADMHDDWLRIHIGDTELSEPICIDNLEHNTYSKESKHDITVTYYNDGKLNGKVSNIKISDSGEKYGPIDIVAYEKTHCSDKIIAYYNSREDFAGQCKMGNRCSKNDTIQSVRLLKGIAVGTKITLYNSPDRKTKDGYAVIEVLEPLTSEVCINDLGKDKDEDFTQYHNDKHVKFSFHHHTNMCAINCDVNGHVSYVKVKAGK
jgi:hypothetical protein